MPETSSGKLPVYAGVDVGASHTKVALIDAGEKLLGHAVQKSGVMKTRKLLIFLEGNFNMYMAIILSLFE